MQPNKNKLIELVEVTRVDGITNQQLRGTIVEKIDCRNQT
jgi:aspartokinase-like uncharacterized kinase